MRSPLNRGGLSARTILQQFFPAALPFKGPQNLSTIFPQFFHNFSTILPQFFPASRACKMFLHFFHNSSSFGASGLAWGRIVGRKIVDELWKYLVNAAPDSLLHTSFGL
jgi:hypothetical protein